MCTFTVLDYLVEDIYCYSEFHGPSEAIITQQPNITDTLGNIKKFENIEQRLVA